MAEEGARRNTRDGAGQTGQQSLLNRRIKSLQLIDSIFAKRRAFTDNRGALSLVPPKLQL